MHPLTSALRAFQGFDRVVLVGHSYGCLLVTRLASVDDAQRIAAVICISAGFPLPSTFRMRWIFYLPTFVRFFPLLFLRMHLPAAVPLHVFARNKSYVCHAGCR